MEAGILIMTVHDLEDKILSMWATADDIDTFLHRYLESPAGDMSEDDIANTVLGIKTVHDRRGQKLWDAFEKVLADRAPPKMPEFDSNGIRLAALESNEFRYPEADRKQRLDAMGIGSEKEST